jgi:putative hydrolase of the HAD superfamily
LFLLHVGETGSLLPAGRWRCARISVLHCHSSYSIFLKGQERQSLEGVCSLCYAGAVKKKVLYWLFDLDNTLYPKASGLFDEIDDRINRYLQRYFGVSAASADGLRRDYFQRYGLTLVGLMKERDADPDHYLEYVHRVELGRYLAPNARLKEVLESLDAPKAIFTNGSRSHSNAVTGALGVRDAFEEVFDIASTGYIPKPDPLSYRTVLERLGVEGERVVLVEDLERNLPPARELGMQTVLVGGKGGEESADHVLDSPEEIPSILAALEA